MTYAELGQRMSSTEFELWMALASVRSEECPSCGREPREINDWITAKQKCPICKHEYFKVKGNFGTYRGI